MCVLFEYEIYSHTPYLDSFIYFVYGLKTVFSPVDSVVLIAHGST